MDSLLNIQNNIIEPKKDKNKETQLNSLNDTLFSTDSEKSNKSIDSIKKKDTENEAVVLRNIHKTYLVGIEGIPSLRGISLKIAKGEFLIINGLSGSGKSTMLNIIGTIDLPSRGDIKIFNKLIKSNTPDDELSKIRLEKVSFVFQSFNLFPNLSALENVEMPMKIKGTLSNTEIRERAKNLLSKVGLTHRLNHYPNQLSGGEQQRVTIARALTNNPEILLLDEPTGDLDTKNSDLVMNILLDLNSKEGITLIMVTHDVGLKNFGHRIVKVVDGKINNEYLVNEDERNDCIQKLYERLQNQSGLREGVKSLSNQEDSHTVYRKITDYQIKKHSLLIEDKIDGN